MVRGAYIIFPLDFKDVVIFMNPFTSIAVAFESKYQSGPNSYLAAKKLWTMSNPKAKFHSLLDLFEIHYI